MMSAATPGAIYREDEGKPIRKSHENPDIQTLYSEFLGSPAAMSRTSCCTPISTPPVEDLSVNLIGNLLFFLLGGFVLALGWALVGLLCCLTIVGKPIGIQCFKFAGLVLWPFGREIRERQTGRDFAAGKCPLAGLFRTGNRPW